MLQRRLILQIKNASSSSTSQLLLRKGMSSSTSPAVINGEISTVKKVSAGGSSLGQRLLSFSAGLGVGLAVTSYFLYEELAESNEKFSSELRDLDRRLKSIENKK